MELRVVSKIVTNIITAKINEKLKLLRGPNNQNNGIFAPLKNCRNHYESFLHLAKGFY